MPTKERTQAVRLWPTPMDVSDVRVFLGLCGFVRRWIERWYDTTDPIRETALCKTKNATMIEAAFKSQTRDESPQLVVYAVGDTHSVVVFANSVYSKVLNTRPISVGLPLSATFPDVPEAALMKFYH